MSCDSIKDVIIDYVGGQLDSDNMVRIENHISDCAQCQQRVLREREIRRALSEQPTDAPDSEFFDRIMDDIVRSSGGHKHFGFWNGFATAIAAALFAWTVFTPATLVNTENSELTQAVVTLNAQVDQLKNVRISFDSPADFEQVSMSLSLPDHVELVGYAGERELTWTTTISKGINILTLPIMVKHEGKGVLYATVSRAGKTKVFTINLDATARQETLIDVSIKNFSV
ncbi:MAG: hypothetical protein OEZ43_16530 [Gammaproteobacteria bacterium]|nr:hypothetical protein [Gammaproteobacteria bacterium]